MPIVPYNSTMALPAYTGEILGSINNAAEERNQAIIGEQKQKEVNKWIMIVIAALIIIMIVRR